MPFSPETLEQKPYNKCIPCRYMGVKCDGPNPLAMVRPEEENILLRLSEWCRLRKEFLLSHDSKWTNAYIAEQADVAKSTVDKFFAGRLNDIKLSTLARVFKVLVNGSWGEYPCAMDVNEDEIAECRKQIEAANSRIIELQEELDDMTEKKDFFKGLSQDRLDMLHVKDGQIEASQINMGERADFIRRKDRAISILGVALAIMTMIAFFALGSDAILPLF